MKKPNQAHGACPNCGNAWGECEKRPGCPKQRSGIVLMVLALALLLGACITPRPGFNYYTWYYGFKPGTLTRHDNTSYQANVLYCETFAVTSRSGSRSASGRWSYHPTAHKYDLCMMRRGHLKEEIYCNKPASQVSRNRDAEECGGSRATLLDGKRGES